MRSIGTFQFTPFDIALQESVDWFVNNYRSAIFEWVVFRLIVNMMVVLLEQDKLHDQVKCLVISLRAKSK